MGNCSQVNNTTIIGTSAVTYDSTQLPCTDVNTCDGLNSILSKFDTIICNIKGDVDVLTEEVTNITENLMIIIDDVIDINNQLSICCPTTTTTSSSTSTSTTTSSTSTTTSTTSTSSTTSTTTTVPITTTTTSSSSTSTTTSTTSTTSTSSSTTTSTTTTITPFEGCIKFNNSFETTSQDCLGTSYPLINGTFTVELVDTLGNPVIATEDITINVEFEVRQCLDFEPVQVTEPIIISNGTSSSSYTYVYETQSDCGQGECELEYEYFQSIVNISPSSYSLCQTTTTTTTTL